MSVNWLKNSQRLKEHTCFRMIHYTIDFQISATFMTDLVPGGDAGLLVCLPVHSPQTSVAFTDWLTSNLLQ